MPAFQHTIGCQTPACERTAVCKIAARWSDGATQELKTFALCCEPCLRDWYRVACAKQLACRLAPGETLDAPGVYAIERCNPLQKTHRLLELERSLRTPPAQI